jgi:RNA polymerase sigma-70 factor, ECF subfamily
MSGPDSGNLRGNHDQHAPALLRYAQLLTSDRARAAVVAQQTLQRAGRDPEVADSPARSARAWLFSNARNLIVDDRHNTDITNEIGAAGSVWPDRAAPKEINATVDRLLLADALAQLPGGDRTVLRYAYYERRTTAQIAADLGITEEAVKSRLHGALRTLWPQLREMGVAVH